MRTAGLTMNDVWAGRVLRERGVETYRYDAQAAEIGVLVDFVELKHRSKEENHRPYLHLTGELRSITPATPLPYGITSVTYSGGQGETVDAFYEFDDEQLVALARKGYFNPAFKVPDQITGVEWELPATVDVLVLAPSEQESDAPVVFTQVHDIASLEIDLSSSGYDLTDYFDDYSKDGVERAQVQVDERGLRARSDAINSLFTEEELEGLVEPVQPRHAAESEAAPVDAVDAQLSALRAEIDSEREQYQTELERMAGTPENLYHERVASRLAQQESTVQPEAEPTDTQGLEFDSEPALEDQVPGYEDATVKRRRETESTTVDLDLGLSDDDHGLGS